MVEIISWNSFQRQSQPGKPYETSLFVFFLYDLQVVSIAEHFILKINEMQRKSASEHSTCSN